MSPQRRPPAERDHQERVARQKECVSKTAKKRQRGTGKLKCGTRQAGIRKWGKGGVTNLSILKWESLGGGRRGCGMVPTDCRKKPAVNKAGGEFGL